MKHHLPFFLALIVFLPVHRLWGQHGSDANAYTPRLVIPKGHTSGISSAQFSPDGNQILTQGYNSVKVWDTSSGRLMHDFTGPISYFTGARFSPDGTQVLTTSLDGPAKVWDARTGKLIFDIPCSGCSPEYSPDGKILWKAHASSSWAWDAVSGEPSIFQPDKWHWDAVLFMTFSPDGKQALAIFEDGTVAVGDPLSGSLLYKLPEPAYFRFAEYNPNGMQIATLLSDGTAMIWDARSGNFAGLLPGRFGHFSPDGTQVLTMSDDSTAVAWDALTRNPVRTIPGTRQPQYSQGGQWILGYNADGRIEVQDALTGALRHELEGQTGLQLRDIQYSPDDRQILGLHNGNGIIWDARSGKIIHRLDAAGLSAAQYHPDGTQIVTGGEHGAITWDVATGRPIHHLTGFIKPVRAAQYSPDRARLLTVHDNTAVMWDARSGHLLHAYAGQGEALSDVQYHPEGRSILALQGATAKVWDAHSQKLLFSLQGVEAPQYSPGGESILALQDTTAKVWDADTGKLLFNLQGAASAHFNPNGESVLTLQDSTVKVWDARSGEFLFRLRGVASAQFNPDGKSVLTLQGRWKPREDIFALELQDPMAKVWDARTGALLNTFTPPDAAPLFYSPDGKYFLANNSENNRIEVRDAWSGELVHDSIHVDLWFNGKGYSPDGKQIATVTLDYVQVWDAATGKELFLVPGQAFQYSPDGKQMATITQYDNVARVYDTHTGKLIHELVDEAGIRSVQYYPEGNLLLLRLVDGAIGFWAMDTGEELFKLYLLDQNNWIALHPSGLFDASPEAMLWMYYLVGSEFIELNQLKERYYEPGLMQKLLGFSDDPLRSVEGFDTVALYPVVSLELDTQSHRLQIGLTPRNGGLGKVSVFINGKEIIEDANPPQGFEKKRSTSLNVNLAQYSRYFLQDSLNTISVRAYNEAGWLKSPVHSVAYHPRFALSKGTGNNSAPSPAFQATRDAALYAIIIGTANYAGDKLDLNFPGKDAEAMASAIQQAGGQLFGADSVVVRLFTTDTTELSMHPSKDNIRKAFEAVKARAKAEDILLVYLSGHGVTYGDADRAQFYYLTQEIASENLSDEGVRNTRAISTAELTKWINDIPAQKQVMILDACNSGKVVELLESGTKNLNSTQIRALDRMKDRTGMFVLAGSAADKVSYEASQYGQGLLTYSLLEWMKYRALEGDSTVDVVRLFEYARDRVPKLASEIGGIQTPTMATPNSGGFAVGLINERVEIPLPQMKPVFIRNVFQNEDSFDDELGLGQALADYFRSVTAKGAQAELIYVDVSEYKNAYSLKGLYSVAGDAVTVRARLFKGKTVVGEAFTVTGKKEEAPGLVEAIMAQVDGMLK
ncbi:MAG: caspase family protein [Lewinellaceae bacterium]|nr:caspase family protein [Lewinellaceae bacterium]